MHQNLVNHTIKNFSFISILNENTISVIYEAYDEDQNDFVSIKVIPRKLLNINPKLEELVKAEIKILRECKNQNVIKLITAFTSDQSIFIVMECCDGEDLGHYLFKKKHLTEQESNSCLKQILNGFKGLHEVNAMHRDFKITNVLIHEGKCKITGLSFAKKMEESSVTKTVLGTIVTMAPEVIQEQPYGREADIWSIGVVYYQLLFGKYPYTGFSDYDVLKKIKKNRPDYSSGNISKNARDFLDKCLTVDPKQRIGWKQIYQHPLILQQSQDKVYALKSRINIHANQSFYAESNLSVSNGSSTSHEQSEQIDMFEEDFEMAEVVPSSKKSSMLKLSQDKKKINAMIEQYEQKYLEGRDNLMFVFKFITPYIYNLYTLSANHGITMFIISKNAYHAMKSYYQNVFKEVNFLGLNPYFSEFVQSYAYETLIQKGKSDLDMITAHIQSYKEDISVFSPEIKAEFEINHIASKNWNLLLKDTVNAYVFQLSEHLPNAKPEQNINIIQVILALNYYTRNCDKFDKTEFQLMMKDCDFKKQEEAIKRGIKKQIGTF